MFSYQGGEQGNNSCIVTPMMFIQPKALAKTGTVPGEAKMNHIMHHTTGAPKCIMPYGSQAMMSRKVFLCAERMLLMLAP